VGRKSISGGVRPLGVHRIQFDFRIAGVRYRPTLPWIPHEANLRLPFNARTCGDVFDAFLRHEEARVRRDDLAPVTLATHRQILDRIWRPEIGTVSLFAVRYSMLVKVADEHRWSKKTYNNVISALRRAFDFGFQDHPEHHNPAPH
jgi:hypothetical protein